MSDPYRSIEGIIKSTEYREALGLPDEVVEEYRLLAQGEYNINYIFVHPVTGRKLVLRVNAGSQMHLDRQIEYEAHALRLLEETGRTPELLYSDGSRRYINEGILVAEFIPGNYPHYDNRNEMDAVMKCIADIHAVSIPEDEIIWGEPETVPRDTVKLIAPKDSADAILSECETMVRTYMDSPLADKSIKRRLRLLLDRAHEIAVSAEEPSYRCCINTELNSTNFLINQSYARLVDWEKPLYADPAQDLGHLLAPTTTFWKTDHILSKDEIDRLICRYMQAVGDRFDTSGVEERTERLIRITCLRGLTWCAMAWVQYKDPNKLIVNESTRKKLDAYLEDAFISRIESLF